MPDELTPPAAQSHEALLREEFGPHYDDVMASPAGEAWRDPDNDLGQRAARLPAAIGPALNLRIHNTDETRINSVYGTDDRHACMGLRIAQHVLDGTPLPWRYEPSTSRPKPRNKETF